MLAAALLATAAARAAVHPDRLTAIQELKQSLHTLTVDEAAQRFEEMAVHRLAKAPPRQQKIDHMVVLYQENRGFDHFFGCMGLPGSDHIANGHSVPKDPSAPHLGRVNTSCGTAPYVCTNGPGYDTFAGKFKKGTNAAKYPYAPQSDEYSYANGAQGPSMQMFSPEQVPVKKAITSNYGVFNKMYCATPTASTPNHHFTQSATSCGSTNNNDYTDCGGKTLLFPQMTMYDSMWMDNVSFKFYMNSSCGTAFGSTPCQSVGPHTDTSPVYGPDASLAGVARYTDHFFSHRQFYEDAAAGTLPEFSWLNAKEEACDHPCHDIAKGERAVKDVYEALRAGPKWQNTL